MKHPPLILALDASTPPSSLALVAGERLVAERTGPFGRRTDAWILAGLDELLEEAGVALEEVTAIAGTVGPGTFTGIRVALATAMGLGRGRNVPVAGVGTLDALVAAARWRVGRLPAVLALVDARRGQLYAAHSAGDSGLDWGPELVAAEALPERVGDLSDVMVVGSGAEAAGLTAAPVATVATGAALFLADRLANHPEAPLPLPRPHYIRPPDARPGRNPLRRARAARPAPGSTSESVNEDPS